MMHSKRMFRMAAALWLVISGCSTGTTGSTAGSADTDSGSDVVLVDASVDSAADTAEGTDAATALDSASSVDAIAGAGTLTPAERCEWVKKSVAAAGFADRVAVSCDGTYAWLASDTYPVHPLMNGITGTNDQVPVPAPGYKSPVVLAPKVAASPISIDAALGVAVNGVPIYDYTSQGNNQLGVYDPKADTKLTGELDLCGGHSGRGDDYHYHAAPTCMMAAMANAGAEAIIGWAFDGYPIYGNSNPDGSAIAKGTLDVCNGQEDALFGYRYHTSDAPPYIVQCLHGDFDVAGMAPRVQPLDNAAGGGKKPGEKPPGGVQNLKLEETPDGTRTMSYDWQGKNYHIQYKPAAQANCWDFEEQSFTTGGKIVKSTYCRKVK